MCCRDSVIWNGHLHGDARFVFSMSGAPPLLSPIRRVGLCTLSPGADAVQMWAGAGPWGCGQGGTVWGAGGSAVGRPGEPKSSSRAGGPAVAGAAALGGLRGGCGQAGEESRRSCGPAGVNPGVVVGSGYFPLKRRGKEESGPGGQCPWLVRLVHQGSRLGAGQGRAPGGCRQVKRSSAVQRGPGARRGRGAQPA